MDGRSERPERAWVAEAVATMADALLILDEKAQLVYRNAAALNLVGLSSVSPDVSRWSDDYGVYRADERTRFPSEELPPVRALRGEAVRDVPVFVRNATAPQGVHILASASPLRDPDGTIRGASCVFRDVTLMRQREKELDEAKRRSVAILDNIPELAWLKDEHGRYLVVNQQFADAVGKKSPAEIIGLTDLDFLPAADAERYRRDDAEVMQTGVQKRMEESYIDPRGRLTWLETVKARIVDDGGNVIGTTGISHDITDRKQVEESMRTAQDELERRVRERTAELAEAQENLVRQERLVVLGQLAGGVAHQIRNPLAAIMNATYVLKRHVTPGQHQNVEDAIRIINDEVRHANVIITGLLDYARVRTPNRHPSSVTDLLERILGSDWLPANVHVVKELPEGDPVILSVDTDQLQGAISNLVHNAIEAMPEGGTLHVALRVLPGEVVITVSDTGSGISPQVRTHLFEPLHSTKPMGIGLGLVTARRFVEAHGGRIASIDVAQGARFEIRLPVD